MSGGAACAGGAKAGRSRGLIEAPPARAPAVRAWQRRRPTRGRLAPRASGPRPSPCVDPRDGSSTPRSRWDNMPPSLGLLLALLLRLWAASCSLALQPTGRTMGGSSLAGVVAGSSGKKPHRSGWDKPYFDDVSPRNVTAIVGQTAELSCHVKHPGERTVSWMRKRDLHILTSSVYTYTGDGRFSVSHPETSDEWRLRIAYVQPRDAGVYECQINTEPKLNLAFALRVEAAQARIREPEDVYVKKGSTISLTCTVNVQSTPPSSVSWHHGGSVVDFDSPRGGISLETEKTESGTTSKLLVTQARLSDSGNYTCTPSNANPASVTVHVLNGEHPAAMQHGGTTVSGAAPVLLLAVFTPLLGDLIR